MEKGLRNLLLKILDKDAKCCINVSKVDEKITISIFSGNKWHRFKNIDTEFLEADIRRVFPI